MSIALRRNSFVVRFKETLQAVRGYTLTYEGHKMGIYRTENKSRLYKRKYNWILVDLESGCAICERARKSYLVEGLEKGTLLNVRKSLDILDTDFYKAKVEEFRKLQKGA